MVEFETAAFVADELRKLPLDALRTGVGKTGVLGTLQGGKPGPVTLLRADMDALPITEVVETPYISRKSGVMHACGHDGHVAILLAAARTLCERRAEVPGTLVFCFQPGEEGSAGNRLMIEDGALENPHVDRTFALHLFSGLDVGKIGIRDGPFFASADEYFLTIKGKGGHGAMPQLAVDPVVAGAYFVTMLQTIVSREVAPKDPAVFTVGKFDAGTTFNVIPDTATLMGTVRCFDPEVRAAMPERMKRILGGLCAAMRTEYELDYHWSYPPTVNDRATNDVVREVAGAVLGAEAVVDGHDIVMWAEDMSFMQEQRPGAYFIVGARGGPETAFPHHNARFDIDERALEVGYKMMVGLGLHA
jgi:amidohydrolase